MKILYCGELQGGGTCRMRMDALARLGHTVEGVEVNCPLSGGKKLVSRILHRLGWPVDWAGANRRLLACAAASPPDLVWIDKGAKIAPATLQRLRTLAPAVLLIHYSPDDMRGRHNRSWRYSASVPLYDLHATTKSFAVAELRAEGARDVILLNNAFCPQTHWPREVADRAELGGPVGFIGTFEPDRAHAMLRLAEEGIPVRIWGDFWQSWASAHPHSNLRVEGRAIFGEDYARAISSFDINLGFLRKLNRDLQTQRSVEIPACGGFLLAERTGEHQSLFREGVEADYFGSTGELIEKCRHYLSRPEERRRIAQAARRRCQEADYSYDRHVAQVIRHAAQGSRKGAGVLA